MHRSLSPLSVVVAPDGSLRLTDFMSAAAASKHAVPPLALRAPYAALEVLDSFAGETAGVTPAADVYSAAVILVSTSLSALLRHLPCIAWGVGVGAQLESRVLES